MRGGAAFISLAAFLLAGCGGSPQDRRSAEEKLAERALSAAFAGDSAGFVSLVEPSFVANARAQMPDVDDVELGGILIAGFTEDIPFRGIKEAIYDISTCGDRAVVHVWGLFTSPDGGEVEVGEADAVRIPLIRVEGNWHLDLLDL